MPKRRFSITVKLAAIAQVKAGKSVAEVAKSLDIADSLLYSWIEKYGQPKTKPDGTTPIGNQARQDEAAERIRLRSYRRFDGDFKRLLVQRMRDGTSVLELAQKSKIGAGTL